jgi:geranylgeranyl pyrophosphate synthase
MQLDSARLHTPGELRDAVEAYLGSLALTRELGGLEEALRYALESGGKRIRPVLCLAVAEAAGGSVEHALPAAGPSARAHVLCHDDLRRWTTARNAAAARARTSRSARSRARR